MAFGTKSHNGPQRDLFFVGEASASWLQVRASGSGASTERDPASAYSLGSVPIFTPLKLECSGTSSCLRQWRGVGSTSAATRTGASSLPPRSTQSCRRSAPEAECHFKLAKRALRAAPAATLGSCSLGSFGAQPSLQSGTRPPSSSFSFFGNSPPFDRSERP
jgi:hypothetical protein